jgi:hypothetical protein
LLIFIEPNLQVFHREQRALSDALPDLAAKRKSPTWHARLS